MTRKYRGPRRRSRAALLARRRLTPAEIDALARVTVSRAVKSKIIALDRVATPFCARMRKAFDL